MYTIKKTSPHIFIIKLKYKNLVKQIFIMQKFYTLLYCIFLWEVKSLYIDYFITKQRTVICINNTQVCIFKSSHT